MKEPDPIPDPFDETHVAVHTLIKSCEVLAKMTNFAPLQRIFFQ